MKNNVNNSLRQQFVLRMFIVLIVTALLTGLIQLYQINQQIARETENQATMIGQSINTGIQETIIASSAIERQIDLKLISYAKNIAEALKDKSINEMTNEDLKGIRDQLGTAGITLLERREGDVVGVLSTEPQDIGFSLKEVGFLEAANTLLNGGKAVIPGATYIDNNIAVLPIAQSGTHTDEPVFYKYSYYHPPGKPYVISVFIEAGEVYQFTREIGADVWISKVMEENSNVMEIGVITPKVVADPALEKQIYPPLKKLVHGTFNYESEEDVQLLKQLAVQPQKASSIQSMDNKKIYKMFLPITNDQVVYIALDYGKLSAPLYRHSIILIVSGFVSLIALFMLTASFFNKIYRNIQQMIKQIKLLEEGDFTAQSQMIGAKGELADLSVSANRMVNTLNQVLRDTSGQAVKVQRLAVLLEAEANQSVEKVFTLSMETTSKARDDVEELNDLLDQVKAHLLSGKQDEHTEQILQQVEQIRFIAAGRSEAETDITITLADLLKSLHAQSSELLDISKALHQKMAQFKL